MGIGYLSRRFGLTVDNLLSADVVLADGTFVTASETSHPDLFWALRGGGGNFGIVTSFTFRCHDIGEHGTIIGGPVLYDLADTAEVMRWYRELLPSLPEELSGWIALLTIPRPRRSPRRCGAARPAASSGATPGRMTGQTRCSSRSGRTARRCWWACRPMPFSVLQSAFDALYPAGLQWYWRADFFNEISDAAIEVHRKYGAQLPTGHSTMHMYPIDGAASRVPADATAFAYRDGGWAGVIVGVDPDPANADLISQWARDYWQACTRRQRGGAYVNFMMNEGQDRVRRPTAATTTGSPRSRTATTRTTHSTSTRTSSPPPDPTRRRRPGTRSSQGHRRVAPPGCGDASVPAALGPFVRRCCCLPRRAGEPTVSDDLAALAAAARPRRTVPAPPAPVPAASPRAGRHLHDPSHHQGSELDPAASWAWDVAEARERAWRGKGKS